MCVQFGYFQSFLLYTFVLVGIFLCGAFLLKLRFCHQNNKACYLLLAFFTTLLEFASNWEGLSGNSIELLERSCCLENSGRVCRDLCSDSGKCWCFFLRHSIIIFLIWSPIIVLAASC